jgi:hypothetical protein
MVPLDVDSMLREAAAACQKGNLGLANVQCLTLVANGYRHPLCFKLLGQIAVQIREFKAAVGLLTTASAAMPGDAGLKAQLDAARKMAREQSVQRPDGRTRYLVIKPWGYGFCSDLDHVLGSLLVAEMSGRVPIVHWGKGSLFHDDQDEEGWSRFFEPVSRFSVKDVIGKGYAWFPSKWTDANIRDAEVNKMSGPGSRTAGILLLNQRAEVAVSDMHVPVIELITWIRAGHPWAGLSVQQVYPELVKKHLRPQAAIIERVEAFASAHFKDTPVIAAHVRGGDKHVEDPLLTEKNTRTAALVGDFLRQRPQGRLFLLTDDETCRRSFSERFGERMITTECIRTTTDKGVHYTQQSSRSRLGEEILTDMYLATRCDAFVGVGSSNVPAMIEHLKDWPPGSFTLHGHSRHGALNPFLHRPSSDPVAGA